MRPFLSSPAEEMMSWLDCCSPDFARFMRPPAPCEMPVGGDGRLDIFRVCWEEERIELPKKAIKAGNTKLTNLKHDPRCSRLD